MVMVTVVVVTFDIVDYLMRACDVGRDLRCFDTLLLQDLLLVLALMLSVILFNRMH